MGCVWLRCTAARERQGSVNAHEAGLATGHPTCIAVSCVLSINYIYLCFSSSSWNHLGTKLNGLTDTTTRSCVRLSTKLMNVKAPTAVKTCHHP